MNISNSHNITIKNLFFRYLPILCAKPCSCMLSQWQHYGFLGQSALLHAQTSQDQINDTNFLSHIQAPWLDLGLCVRHVHMCYTLQRWSPIC